MLVVLHDAVIAVGVPAVRRRRESNMIEQNARARSTNRTKALTRTDVRNFDSEKRDRKAALRTRGCEMFDLIICISTSR